MIKKVPSSIFPIPRYIVPIISIVVLAAPGFMPLGGSGHGFGLS